MSEEKSGQAPSSSTNSTQSTPTPPGRGRRLRKCATPIKSAKKVEQHEKVTIHKGPPTLPIPSSTNSSNSEATPSSSGATTPAKPEPDLKISVTPVRPLPLLSPTSLPHTPNLIKKGKRIPYTLVEASKGNRCPTPGCNGVGHATGLYAMHYAVSGCPLVKRELEKSQSNRVPPLRFIPRGNSKRKKRRGHLNRKRTTKSKSNKSIAASSSEPASVQESKTTTSVSSLIDLNEVKEHKDILSMTDKLLPSVSDADGSPVKRKRIPYTLIEVSKGNRCPTPGCNGLGHITGLYAMHYAVSGCPLAHGKTPEECKSRREELNKLRIQANPSITAVTSDSALYLSPSPRKTLRLQASRNLSVSLDGVTGATPIPQQQKMVTQSGSITKTRKYYFRPEPKLEGLTNSQDLQLFREAQAKMREQLGIEAKKGYDLSKIQFGNYEIDTWFTSPYPPEYTQLPQIYVCEFCLRYYKTQPTYEEHKLICTQLRPPGREIYRKNQLSIFEVDGENHKEYCQNLCLLAKLFLDHKTLYFDVEPFLFYIGTVHDDKGWHINGYFSKEKHSPQGYNVSCILVIPPYMRNGYGRLLIDFSYLLTRQQEMVGSPERPLSDLGLLCYRSYWKDIVLAYLSNTHSQAISIKEISQETGINPDDLISSLQYYGLLKYWKGKHIIIRRKDMLDEHSRKLQNRKSKELIIDPSCLQWAPTTYPVY